MKRALSNDVQRRILIVDDDDDIRCALSDLLEADGYDVHAVARGHEALHQVQQLCYGAAILDMRLPDLDGPSVLKLMMQLDPSLPVVVLTGHRIEAYTVGSLSRGAFAYLSKPYNSQEMIATVQKAVSLRALEAKAAEVEVHLRRSEVRFHAVIESAPDAIIIADGTGRILSWNCAAEKMFGYSAEDVMGRFLTELMPVRYRDAHQRGLDRLRTTGESRQIGKTLELAGLRKDGTEFPLELSLATWNAEGTTFYSGIIRDITERKQVEDAVRESRQRYQTLVNSIDGIVWEWGPDTSHFTFVSQQAERILGYSLDRWLKELTWQDLVHRDDLDRVFSACMTAIEQRRNYELQYRMMSADGRCVWVKHVASVVTEPGGTTTLCGILLDITEQKQTEAALSESQERFRQAAENIREVLWISDVEKNSIMYVSPGYEQIWGQSCESLYRAPRSWLEAIHPDDRDRVLTAALTKQALGEYSEEYRIVRPDGSIRWIHDRAFPVRDATGRIYRVTGIADDITERKEAQAALRQAYDNLDAILRSLPGSILIVDDLLQILYTNPLAEQQFGNGRVLAGSSVDQVLPISALHWEELMAEHRRSPGRYTHDGEFETAGKRAYQYRLFSLPIGQQGHQRAGIVIWDVTEQRQLQDQLIQADKLASLGTLVSGIAHEINNPVQGILSMAEIIGDEHDVQKIKEYARDIVEYSTHIRTVVYDLACYARPGSRNGEVQVDVQERLLEAVKMVRRCPDFGNVEVITAFECQQRLYARQAEIDQVFVNLISNAVQAMGGNGRLTLRTSASHSTVIVSISDTGSGISPSVKGKIFDPFFTTKEPGKGTGLGLNIVHRLVSKYGGSIDVDSEEGKGTTFTIAFHNIGSSQSKGGPGNAYPLCR